LKILGVLLSPQWHCVRNDGDRSGPRHNALATLAVQDHGRKKPFTTFAQEMLLTRSGHGTLTVTNPDAAK